MGAGSFTAAAQLRWHRALVLTVQHVHTALPTRPQQQEGGAPCGGCSARHVLAATGGSDGSLAVWNLSAVALPGLDDPQPASEASKALLRGGPLAQEAAQEVGGSCLKPLMTQRAWHPGAIHALSVSTAGELENCGQEMHCFCNILWPNFGRQTRGPCLWPLLVLARFGVGYRGGRAQTQLAPRRASVRMWLWLHGWLEGTMYPGLWGQPRTRCGAAGCV